MGIGGFVMGLQKISYMVDKNGKVTIQVENVTGNDCKELTRDIETKLGTVENVEYKEEYYSNSNYYGVNNETRNR